MKKLIFVLALALACSPQIANAKSELTLADKVLLQATMQQSIDRVVIDGVFLSLDRKDHSIRKLYPAKNHPMIMRMGDHYILCANFRDDKGEDINVDFYMAPKGKSFVVYHTAIDDRATVQSLMKKGVVVSAR